jgi:hypothetical protein
VSVDRQDAEAAAADAVLPDFGQLVNFPDFLARGRVGEGPVQVPYGKKYCVMCGELRVCSAHSVSSSTRTRQPQQTGGADQKQGEGETMHIIPRQNKGVCTACDVTVWKVVGRDELEIKWCKGCKNFRGWEAFGEKGRATKCVRCRTRQKEKYAAAKEAYESNL